MQEFVEFHFWVVVAFFMDEWVLVVACKKYYKRSLPTDFYLKMLLSQLLEIEKSQRSYLMDPFWIPKFRDYEISNSGYRKITGHKTTTLHYLDILLKNVMEKEQKMVVPKFRDPEFPNPKTSNSEKTLHICICITYVLVTRARPRK